MILYSLLSVLKTMLYKIAFKCVSVGNKTIIDFESCIWPQPASKIIVGNNVHLRSRSYKYHTGMAFPTTLYTESTAIIIIGDNSRLNGVFVHASKEISIGRNCVIAAGVQIIDRNGHIVSSFNRTRGSDMSKSIRIDDNVWIGVNSIILKGTEIGENSVIGAGSVVQGVFPANSLIKGNPAIVVAAIQL